MTSLAAPERLRGLTGVLTAAAASALIALAATVLPLPVVLVLGAGVAGAVGVLTSRAWALTALAAFVVLRLPEVATEFHGAPSLFLPLMALLLFAMAVGWRIDHRLPEGGVGAVLVVVAFTSVAALSLLASDGTVDSIGTLRSIVEDGAVAILVGLLVRSTAGLRALVWAMISFGGLVAGLSLWQYATGSFGSELGGLAQSAVQNIVGTADDVRVSGPVGDPNFYAQWLVMLVPFAADRIWDEASAGLRRLALALTVLLAAAVVITFSRGGALGLGVIAIGLVVRHRPRPRTIAIGALAAVALLPLAPGGWVDRLAALGDVGTVEAGIDPSVRSRTAEVTAAWRMFTSDPLTGVGYGAFTDHYLEATRDLGIDLRATPREAHNLYLQFLAEMGLLGLILLAAIAATVAASVSRGRAAFRRIADLRGEGIAFASGLSLLGYAVTSVFLHLDLARLPWLVMGIALVLPVVARAEDRRRTETLPNRSPS